MANQGVNEIFTAIEQCEKYIKQVGKEMDIAIQKVAETLFLDFDKITKDAIKIFEQFNNVK